MTQQRISTVYSDAFVKAHKAGRFRDSEAAHQAGLRAVVEACGGPRLSEIAEIIEAVDNRCMAADGPVTPTEQEITGAELRRIYRLATRPKPKAARVSR